MTPAGLDDLFAGYPRPDPAMPRLDQARPAAWDYRARFPEPRLAPELSPAEARAGMLMA